jgi:hypothetical protein
MLMAIISQVQITVFSLWKWHSSLFKNAIGLETTRFFYFCELQYSLNCVVITRNRTFLSDKST